MALKYHEHKTKLEGILQSNKDIFVPGEALSVKPTTPINGQVQMFLPDSGNKSYRLRDGIGYLSGAELLQLNNRNEIEKTISYSYAFCLENHTYICSNNGLRTQNGPFPYEIRYEQDTRDILVTQLIIYM